ncbi:hypothetical protein CBR_g31037 [Chara braunii]|uniref:RNA helicase n=1 Tax=Chara braunii TaxID=69332 RepID=A0A388LE85_CHABU|nr:hypothetical protein CBR_g31037 [Chara braunii]|eukprot:GBG80577.1 hypothetical protein CBR_g31037 [Chara braunii]
MAAKEVGRNHVGDGGGGADGRTKNTFGVEDLNEVFENVEELGAGVKLFSRCVLKKTMRNKKKKEQQQQQQLNDDQTLIGDGERESGDRRCGNPAPCEQKTKKKKKREEDDILDNDVTGSPSPSPSLRSKKVAEEDSTRSKVSFEQLGLSEWLLSSCREMGIIRPTQVQEACIPHILKGEDVIGNAETGSGKTAAFALPILQRLAEDPYGICALVLTPTRELAFQIADQFRVLGAGQHLRDAVVVGGVDLINQALLLARRPHVVIATPGRLKDHLENDPSVPGLFNRLKFLVLDEADQLLDAGFEVELRAILQCLPPKRQTLLFSATMTGTLKKLREMSMHKAFYFEVYKGLQTVGSLKQQYIFIPDKVKEVYLCYLMETLEEMNVRSLIVFASSCRTCQTLQHLLQELDIPSTCLHSMKPQPQRLAALNKFKSGVVPILIATDVASRGLDIPTVDLVVNFDMPQLPRNYVHRVGRTARAGRAGRAVSLITQYDVELVHKIEELIGQQLEELPLEEDVVLKRITDVYNAKRVATLKIAESGFEEQVEARLKTKRKRKREQAQDGGGG